MSEHGIHVHGAHEHAVEHEAHKTSLGQQVAIFSALLATVGAVVSYLGGHTQNEALYYKNEAVLKRTEASDQWNFYQAKSMKQNLAEMAASINTDPAKVEQFKKEAERYSKEKAEIMKEAKVLEDASKAQSVRSERALHPHERLAMSMTLMQIAIALASITVLTQKRWLLVGAGTAAALGAGVGVLAYLV